MQRRHKTNSLFTFRRSRESDVAAYGALVEVIGGPQYNLTDVTVRARIWDAF